MKNPKPSFQTNVIEHLYLNRHEYSLLEAHLHLLLLEAIKKTTMNEIGGFLIKQEHTKAASKNIRISEKSHFLKLGVLSKTRIQTALKKVP